MDENGEQQDAFISSSKKPSSLKAKLALNLSPSKRKKSLLNPKKQNHPDPEQFFINKSEEKAFMIAKLMFPNLTHLDLSSNRIERLPGKISYIENLSYLNASSNANLLRVSPKLGLLTKLWNFDLKNSTNIREPIMLETLIKQRTKTSDLLGYLKSILEDSRPYTRIKLMFVGIQAIGKTSLLNKLREEGGVTTSYGKKQQNTWSERSLNSSITSNVNISTVGIDINEWIYEKPKPKSSASNSLSASNTQVNSSASITNMSQNCYIYQMDGNQPKHFGPIT
jgi:Leucine-rich repeat (LRR) protein